MTLYICLNVYAESRMLPGCLASIRKAAPEAKIVAVDGAYENWVRAARRLAAKEIEAGHDVVGESILHYASPASPDDTLKILQEAKVHRIISCEKPWAHEYEKRSQYFVGQKGDWYLVMDADEQIEGRVDLRGLEDPAYNVMLFRDQDQHPYPITRLFRHQDGMAYRGAHHALFAGDILWRKEICKTVGGKGFFESMAMTSKERLAGEPFSFYHLYEARGNDVVRNWIRGEYYRHLTSVEEYEFRCQAGL